MERKFILSHMSYIYNLENLLSWFIYPNGKLVGYFMDNNVPTYEFWVANPPARDSKDYSLFIAVCEFAVAKGILQPMHTYAVVEK
jgi:hypothetical protein